MTRKQLINALVNLGLDPETAIIRYYAIKDFLYANNSRLYEITDIMPCENYDPEEYIYISLDYKRSWLQW